MRFPDDSERLVIVGATGSGKSQAATWHLSHRDFHLMPWIAYNFKGDAAIDAIPGAVHIDMDELPSAPGVYIAHPSPADLEPQADAEISVLDHHLNQIWERQEIGVFIDEGAMVGQRSTAYRRLLIQGRSRMIPMIICSQRPKWMDAYTFTEANFWQVFRLAWVKDRAAVGEFVPSEKINERLPRFESIYYDVRDNVITPLKPVPDMRTIHATFARRLGRKRVVGL